MVGQVLIIGKHGPDEYASSQMTLQFAKTRWTLPRKFCSLKPW